MDHPVTVFISYAWTSEKYKEQVLHLAERLVKHGIDVKIDEWDLSLGDDKFQFMESMVNSPFVDKVLIVCNSEYQRKADDRDGGVGYETSIITPEIVKQVDEVKFIPVILEDSENPEDFIPTYLSSRIYIDLSKEDIYEEKYEELLRHLYKMPKHQKPTLGKKPKWLNEEEAYPEFVDLRLLRVNLAKASTSGKITILLNQYFYEFFRLVKEYRIDPPEGFTVDTVSIGNDVLSMIDRMRPLRDEYVSFLITLIEIEHHEDEFLPSFFENYYNEVLCFGKGLRCDICLKHFEFFLWEIFVDSIAILMKYGSYKAISNLILHTYFLKMGRFKQNPSEESSIVTFWYNDESIIQNTCKALNPDKPSKFSFAADLLVNRENIPYLTMDGIACGDILIFLLSYINRIDEYGHWHPLSYVYEDSFSTFVQRFSSKSFCNKVLTLFDVDSIDELKQTIADLEIPDVYWGYQGSGRSYSSYLQILKNMGIASKP